MEAGHSHAIPEGGNERSLLIALGLTSGFLIIEVIGGLITGSLALISDAAHMFTDAAALAIALAAVRVGRMPADSRRTFGYYRFEILAAAFNAILLFAVALYILYEAYHRLQNPPEIQSLGMLVIGVVGMIVNLVAMRLLAGGKESSLNVKGAYLEVWSDMLGSAGVIAGALVIRWTGWTWVDSAVAVAIGLWVVPRTWALLKESLNILLEGVPQGIDLDAVARAMREVAGVQNIHDLHVWAITSGKTSLTAHAVVAGADPYTVTTQLRELLAKRFGIFHSTVQCEPVSCGQADEAHSFIGPGNGHDSHHHKH